MKTKFKLRDSYFLEIWQDENAESPNENGNEDTFLVYDHRSFTVNRDNFEPQEIHNYLTVVTDDKDEVTDYSNYWIFVVYAYIHSGVSLSLGNTEFPYNCNWDTSSTGYILVKKDILQQGAGNVEKDLTQKEAHKYAESLIKEWNTYLSGDIYGFTVVEEVKCELCKHIEEESVDSCGGFYKLTDVDLLADMLINIDVKYYPKTPHNSVQLIAQSLLN